jgi:hypothetical protein
LEERPRAKVGDGISANDGQGSAVR